MAEAEDVIVEAARHATAYAQDLWQRRRRADAEAPLGFVELAPRLSLLLTALHGEAWSLRVAQPPAPVTALARLFLRTQRPWPVLAVPCAYGRALWLPRQLDGVPAQRAIELFRAMALQHAARSRVRPAELSSRLPSELARELYLVLEAEAADAALARSLPGLESALRRLREAARRRRPPRTQFAPRRWPLEAWFRARAEHPCAATEWNSDALIDAAQRLAAERQPLTGSVPLLKDWWTGDFPQPELVAESVSSGTSEAQTAAAKTRSARLLRRPKVRRASEGEDDQQPGAFMIQTSEPHEHAEDPLGAQRPTDRDADSAAEGHAESVAELAEARLVRSAQPAYEVLLSDDPPSTVQGAPRPQRATSLRQSRYPEWDYRRGDYRDPGATVWECEAEQGSELWVERTLAAQRGMLFRIRRQFEMLRAHPITLHRQNEGDEIDLDACIEARADVRAGAALSQRLYRQDSLVRRDTAIVVLVDISGSTDGWLAGNRRIIDVEREALLPLSVALDALREPYGVLAFSGEGPGGVTVRTVKRLSEPFSRSVALRIAGLEPEHYTRVGAALRHGSALLLQQTARHRLLLLLSDGRPNDCDQYEGRYGVEDTRQAVLEARRAGLSTFCLTVDRQAGAYMPRMFGVHHYALLQQPERLPIALLDWMKRLLKR